MADDKIVTKKTAAKKAAAKTTATQKSAVTQPADKVAKPDTPKPLAKKKAQAKSPAKMATTTPEAAPAGTPSPAVATRGATSSPKQADHQGSLRQLAMASPEQRLDMVREAAYYKAEKRNFAPGHDASDWADAEREIDELLARAKVMTGN